MKGKATVDSHGWYIHANRVAVYTLCGDAVWAIYLSVGICVAVLIGRALGSLDAQAATSKCACAFSLP